MAKVAEKSRACAYSRAGIMWSDGASGAFDPQEVAHDLHAGLTSAGEAGPYVLVSHSRGGLYSMIFAALYSREIAGLVMAGLIASGPGDALPRGRRYSRRRCDSGPGTGARLPMDGVDALVALPRRPVDCFGGGRLLSEVGRGQCAGGALALGDDGGGGEVSRLAELARRCAGAELPEQTPGPQTGGRT